MSAKVVKSAIAADPRTGGGERPADFHRKPVAEPEPAEAPEADHRLIIEDGEGPGTSVYTVVDRRTGRVVSRRRREEVLRMGEQAGYAAGQVFKGSA